MALARAAGLVTGEAEDWAVAAAKAVRAMEVAEMEVVAKVAVVVAVVAKGMAKAAVAYKVTEAAAPSGGEVSLAEPMGAWAVVAAGSQASCRPRTRARHQCKGRSQAPGGGGANAELARMVVWAVS